MNLYNNNYLLLWQEETVYGVEIATPAYTNAIPDMGVVKENTATIEYMQKTGTIEPYGNGIVSGIKGGTFTMSGGLSAELLHKILFKATFSNDSVFIFSGVDTPKSYTCYRYHIGSDLSDIILGCVLESIKITGSFNGLVMYEATYRFREVKRDQATTSAYWTVAPEVPLVTPLKMSDVIFTNPDDEVESIISFEITLTNKFIDDEASYENSDLKNREGLCSPSNGILTFTRIYDTLTGYFYEDMLDSQKGFSIQIEEGTGSGEKWILATMNGKVSEYDQPDGECVFKETVTVDLRGTTSNNAIEITYGTHI